MKRFGFQFKKIFHFEILAKFTLKKTQAFLKGQNQNKMIKTY